MRGWWWWWWWWWIIFVLWLTDKWRLALFPARTITRDPHHRESPTRGEQDNIGNDKYWRRSSLIRNLLNVKYYGPYKTTYSKYQIIKLLENCLQKTNCFSWMKLTPIWIHLKYRHYNFPHLKLPCLPHYPCHISSYHNYWINQIIYNTKPSQSNFLSSYTQIMIFYGSNTLPIKKLSLYWTLPFQS